MAVLALIAVDTHGILHYYLLGGPQALAAHYPRFNWAIAIAGYILPIGIYALFTYLSERIARQVTRVVPAVISAAVLYGLYYACWNNFMAYSTLVCLTGGYAIAIAIVLTKSFWHRALQQVNLGLQDFGNSLQTRKELWFFFLLCLAVRLTHVLFFDNAGETDAVDRLATSFDLIKVIFPHLENKIARLYALNPHPDWPPLHFYLMCAVMKLTGSNEFLPRVMHVLFAALSVAFLYKLFYLFFEKAVVRAALTVYIFSPALWYLSGHTLVEPVYLFFAVTAIYYRIKIAAAPTLKNHLILVLLLTACCWLRYEGWALSVLTGITFLPVIARPFRIRPFLLMALPAAACIYIMVMLYLQHFDIWRGITWSDYTVKVWFNANGRSWSRQLGTMLAAHYPFTLLGTFLFFVSADKHDRRIRLLMLLLLVPFALFLYKLLGFTLTPQFRYYSYYAVLFTPFAFWLLRNRLPKLGTPVGLSVAVALLVAFNAWFFLKAGAPLRHEKGFKESALFARKNLKAGYLLIDAGGNTGSDLWRIYAGITDRNPFGENKLQVRYRLRRSMVQKDLTLQSFRDTCISDSIKYLVLYNNGDISRIKKFEAPAENVDGLRFSRLFVENGYKIYEIQQDSILSR